MIEIRKSHSREAGGCCACTRYRTALGTAGHEVNVYAIGNETVAPEFRLCAHCEDELRAKILGAPAIFYAKEGAAA